MNDLASLFPVHDPPPGGLNTLRARLDAEAEPGWWRQHRTLAAVGATAVVACLLVLSTFLDLGRGAGLAGSVPYAQLVRSGLAEPPRDVVSVPDDARSWSAVEEVATNVPGVRFFRVSSLPVDG